MKHLTLKDFSEDNLEYYVEKPDPNFSAKKNYAIIQKTIAQAAKRRNSIEEKVLRNTQDRMDIVASWAKYKLDQDGGKKLEQWLGKSWMSKIYGEKLLEKIRTREQIQKMNLDNGNDKFLDYYLT